MLNKYQKYILNTNPSITWKVIRFVLHWLTLPLKLLAIGGLGFSQIFRKLFAKRRPVPGMKPESIRNSYFSKVLMALPIYNNGELRFYTNRVPFNRVPDGSNHNTDHQASRQGTFAFLAHKLNIHTESVDEALSHLIQPYAIAAGGGKYEQHYVLCRGYKQNPYDEGVQYNIATVSGDMLCGLNLGMLDTNHAYLKEKYELLVDNIIENDYSLLEGAMPEPGSPEHDRYMELLAVGKFHEAVKMKSARGMWQPGLETVGAQALTLLAALKVSADVCGSSNAKKEYKKMLWLYGYGLLSLFPTAYTDKQRGYFNDHNCIIALYTLSRLSKSKLGRIFWKIPMVYVWMLSKHWYNGYFTGLVNEAHPGTISDKYVQDCLAYLYENEPRVYGYLGGGKTTLTTEVPVTYNDLGEDEFSPDIRHDEKRVLADEADKVKTGLGFLAAVTLLEKK